MEEGARSASKDNKINSKDESLNRWHSVGCCCCGCCCGCVHTIRSDELSTVQISHGEIGFMCALTRCLSVQCINEIMYARHNFSQ